MKGSYVRKFGNTYYESIEHFSFKDPEAARLAQYIRDVVKCSVRVVTDTGSGWTHVFVDEAHFGDALKAALEFQKDT